MPSLRTFGLALLLLALLLGLLAGCGVAPVLRGEVPSAPPSWRYLDQHGRPLAYRGGVCAIKGAHEHKYPPAPKSAFTLTANGWADSRAIVPYWGPHRHGSRTCSETGWHLHLELPPAQGLVFDEQLGAWRAEPLAAEEAARALP